MGRDRIFRDYLTPEIQESAKGFLLTVNAFLEALKISHVTVTSGWRPPPVNDRAGGAPRSYHLFGRAVDLWDPDGKLDHLIETRSDLLRRFGLWLEDPKRTPRWVHLDNGTRPERASRIF